MPALQLISLDTTTPRLRAPASGDTYSAPRAVDITPESLTGSAATSSLSITQTWNTTGTPSAIDLNVTDTASNASSNLLNLRVGGTSQFRVRKDGSVEVAGGIGVGTVGGSQNFYAANNLGGGVTGMQQSSTAIIGWTSGAQAVGSADLVIRRDAANTLAQRNGVNAQAFRIYETFTDASNYSRLNVDYSGGQWRIIPSGAGTGDANRGLLLGPNGQGAVLFQTNNTTRWTIGATTGHLTANVDNTYDIGSSGANRPRDVWAARDVYAQSNAAGFYLGTSSDVAILRDDANILALRRSTNAQTFRIYNTFTDASNYERGVFDWASTPNSLTIGTQQAGTGTARSLRLITQGDANLLFITNSVTRFDVSSLGLRATANLIWTADNTYDIGASGANRPRNLFLAGDITTSGGLTLAAAGVITWPTRASISASATDVVRILGNTTGGALQLVEMTAPAAPGTNNVRIYAEDNGSGKTRLMALFATGAAVQLAIEP